MTPFCVVATIGTTSTTSIDPAAAIAEACERHGLWLHVDAAYAGPAALVPELRPLFAGWERADSIVLNPHKWLFTPMCSSLMYTRRAQDLREAFSLVPEYLRSDVGDERGRQPGDAPIDYMNYGIQLGRPFRSLRLWMVLAHHGREALVERLRDHVRQARWLADRIDEDPRFERLAPVPFSAVCFRYRPDAGAGTGDGTDLAAVASDPWETDNERILERVNARGRIFLSHTRLRGRLSLRVAIGNEQTKLDDIRVAWREILGAADALGTDAPGEENG